MSYFLGEDRSYVWTASSDTVRVQPLPGRGSIERAVARALAGIASDDGRSALQAVTRLRSVLAPRGVWPAAAARVLVIVPESLHQVPFGAWPLVAADGTLAAPDSDRAEVVTLPSLSVAHALVRRSPNAQVRRPRSAVIVADPVFSPDDPRVRGMRAEGVDGNGASAKGPSPAAPLARLFVSRWEAESLSRWLPPDRVRTLLDFDASRRAFLSLQLGRADVIHIATHIDVDAQHPELSAIELSASAPDGRSTRGTVRVHELWNVNVRAQLIALSGCYSAGGRSVRGEGLVGLGRHFLMNGASRLLLTLWPVDDRASAAFMAAFYRHWLGGARQVSAAAAWRAAQLELAHHPEFGHPRHWAAFSLQGDWR